MFRFSFSCTRKIIFGTLKIGQNDLEIPNLEFESHSLLENQVFLPTEQVWTNICWMINQDINFKICLSLFGWKETILPKEHIVHCAVFFFDRIPLIWTFKQLNIIWTFEHLNIWTFEELNICLMLTKSSPESGLDYIPPSQAIPLQVDHFVCISIFSRENKFVLYWMLFDCALF